MCKPKIPKPQLKICSNGTENRVSLNQNDLLIVHEYQMTQKFEISIEMKIFSVLQFFQVGCILYVITYLAANGYSKHLFKRSAQRLIRLKLRLFEQVQVVEHLQTKTVGFYYTILYHLENISPKPVKEKTYLRKHGTRKSYKNVHQIVHQKV